VPQQQADALALLAETTLHHGLDPGAPDERYQVVVHVDAPALADPDQPGQSVLEDGPRVSPETSRRLACDASRVLMRHDESARLVEIGARTRTIPPPCGERSTIETGAAASRGAASASARGTTCATGRTAARRHCRTSRCSVAGITERLDLDWAIDVLHPRAGRSRPCPPMTSDLGG
jgi:hypothetical protein